MIRAALLACLIALPAAAQEDIGAEAQAAAARLAAAAEMLAGAGGASDRIGALTETVQAYEDGLEALREGLRRVATRSRAIEAELDARSEEVARLLATLQTMSRAPAPLLLLHPSGPVGTARAGMVLADVAPAVEARAEALRETLRELADLRALQEQAATTLEQGLRGVQEARARLSEAVSERTDLPRRFTEDPAAIATLVAASDTLDAFAGSLAGIVADTTATDAPDATERKGTLALPVQGVLLRRFGEADAAGIERPGVILATRPQALVTAPAAATIRFAGELLDYGQVAILEPAPDVLIVLAGLGEVYGEAGQILPEGAPVGLMGGETLPAHANLSDDMLLAGASRSETLYLEVREGGSPVDPATWFALAR